MSVTLIKRIFLPSALAVGALFSTGKVAAAVPEADIRRDATVEAVQRVTPSVVNIATKTRVQQRGYLYDWFRNQITPYSQEGVPKFSAGSGVIIDESGFIITNVHVVKDADEIEVKLWDDRPPVRAIPVSGLFGTDVALLKLVGKPGEKFIAATFAADNDVLLGETVLALGNPFGMGASVSRGILSSKPRRESQERQKLEYPDWLQTDAAINPGNSGGALVNLRGEVIGINVAVSKEGQGIGFAIPIKQVSEALSEFFTPEFKKSQWFGVRIKPDTLTLTVVQAGSPAANAGLLVGDKIIQVNGKTPKTLAECSDWLTVADGQKVSVMVERGAEKKTVSVAPISLTELVKQKTGLTVQELTSELTKAMELNENRGLLIAGIDKNSPGEATELKKGYLITGIDGQHTPDVLNMASVLWQKKKGDSVKLLVEAREAVGNFVRYKQGVIEVKVR